MTVLVPFRISVKDLATRNTLYSVVKGTRSVYLNGKGESQKSIYFSAKNALIDKPETIKELGKTATC